MMLETFSVTIYNNRAIKKTNPPQKQEDIKTSRRKFSTTMETMTSAKILSEAPASPPGRDVRDRESTITQGATEIAGDKISGPKKEHSSPPESPQDFKLLGAADRHAIRKTIEPYIPLSAHARADLAQSDSWCPGRDGRTWPIPTRRSASPSPSPPPSKSRHPSIFRGYRTLDSWIALRDGRNWGVSAARPLSSPPGAPRKKAKSVRGPVTGLGLPGKDGSVSKKRLRSMSPEDERNGRGRVKRQRDRDGEWERRRDARSLEDIFGAVTETKGKRGPRISLVSILEG